MKIDQTKCVGCCACRNACPANAIKYVNGKCTVDQNICVNCGTCAALCPMQAIFN